MEGLPISNDFVRMLHPYAAKSITKLYVDTVMKLHGMPRSIVTNRD